MASRRPELLAPAGDLDSLKAALAAGADAVYFGLDEGFNARARASNFPLDTLEETVGRIHRANARAYLTLNTLVFESELPLLEPVLRRVAEAGVDALIVQDPAVMLLARALCPELELHASTQMTLSSAEGLRFARTLGVTRAVVPRELSVAELERLSGQTDMELEVFIHGALCMSWSGQCLTSEAWGGRSANRGQCAQSCRLPYTLIVDGEARPLEDDVSYLLSPKDLAGVFAVPRLIELGIHSLKVEGRQKGPQYVATAIAGYRRWIDGLLAGAPDPAGLRRDLTAMNLSYSRGPSHGFFAGSDHQTLVEGRFPKHRGIYLGRVVAIDGRDVRVAPEAQGRPWTGALGLGAARPKGPHGALASPLEGSHEPERDPRPGMGVVFDAGHPEATDEPGGPIFRVTPEGSGWILGFGTPGPDLARVRPGQRVWLTSDPALARQTRSLIEAEGPTGRHPLSLEVRGREGAPLVVVARSGRHRTEAQSTSLLSAAQRGGLDAALLSGKLGALGGTLFHLAGLETAGLAEGLHLPVSELKALRRELVGRLTTALESGSVREVRQEPVLEALRTQLRATSESTAASGERTQATLVGEITGPARLLPLCREDAQLEAVIAAGLPEVELDWMEMVGLQRAVKRARDAGLRVTLATVRVQKPGEEGYDQRLARLAPDAVLVRHWGALMHFREKSPGPDRPMLHGDFSLNVTNSLTAHHLLALGLDTLTCAHDLDETQLFALFAHAPASRFTIPLHHHISTFHTEHCVYAHTLSSGRDFRSCGRPCEKHRVALRDRTGLEHPVVVDVGCRNTVFNAQAQTAASLVPRLLDAGVRRFRVEFVRESQEEAARVLSAYQELLAGRLSPSEAVRRASAHEQFGVTRGTMQVLQPMAGLR